MFLIIKKSFPFVLLVGLLGTIILLTMSISGIDLGFSTCVKSGVANSITYYYIDIPLYLSNVKNNFGDITSIFSTSFNFDIFNNSPDIIGSLKSIVNCLSFVVNLILIPIRLILYIASSFFSLFGIVATQGSWFYNLVNFFEILFIPYL